MTLQLSGFIELPASSKPGGFDHAALHRASSRVYVAHTANDALDVLDATRDRYLHSIGGLAGVAGALVSDEHNLVFTSNRGENTVGIFRPDDEASLVKVPVGVRPNGLAYDPGRGLLLAANVGDPAIPGSFSLSIVDVKRREMAASIPVPGRTRWTVFDARADAFYVNIAHPAQIVVVAASDVTRVARVFDIPAAAPHGLDLDAEKHRLFCACDAAKLLTVDTHTGAVLSENDMSGVPDVIFLNAALRRLYVAVGDPGVVDVFDTASLRRLESVATEQGAHTLALDPDRSQVFAFLPQTHRAAVYQETTA
jgi:DNA-binding beta-propeller fold protein YncE